MVHGRYVLVCRVDSAPLDKIAAITQIIFSDAFSWMKSFVFWLKFHLIFIQILVNLVPKGLINNNLAFGLDNGLAPKRRQAITNADPIDRRIYATPWGDEFTI